MKTIMPNAFWKSPKDFNTTASTKALTEWLLHYDGRINACGEIWDIKSKLIGPGVYRVWLTPAVLTAPF